MRYQLIPACCIPYMIWLSKRFTIVIPDLDDEEELHCNTNQNNIHNADKTVVSNSSLKFIVSPNYENTLKSAIRSPS